MQRVQIKCINKSDRSNIHERINNIGGDGWKISQQDAISYIKDRVYEFYVTVGGREVDVIVSKSRFGNEYIKTTADGDMPNNLLALPECR